MTTPAHAVLMEGQYNIFLEDDEMNKWDGMFRVDSGGDVIIVGTNTGILIGDCEVPGKRQSLDPSLGGNKRMSFVPLSCMKKAWFKPMSQ